MQGNTGNVATKSKFRLEISGIDEVLFQDVQLPEREIEVATMKVPNNKYAKEIPTNRKLGRMTTKKLVPVGSSDSYIDKWHEDVLNLPRQEYARFATLVQLASDEKTPVKIYDLGEIFPMKITLDNFERVSADLFYETIEWSVSRFEVLPI